MIGIHQALWAVATLVGPLTLEKATQMDQYVLTNKDKMQLKENLVLKEEQGGIAGRTVRTWTVQPSGAWTFVQVLVDPNGAEIAGTRKELKGTLDQRDVKELAKALAAKDLAGLPGALGQKSKVNPHSYVLGFGKRESRIDGALPRRGEPIQENIIRSAPVKDAAEQNPWRRFADIAHVIETVTKQR